jgi:D-lactate dehydrogenase
VKIVVFEVEDWERDAFSPLQDRHEVQFVNRPLKKDTAREYADADVISPFVESDLSDASLWELCGLKLIATRSTGYDHIDLPLCREHGITVCNVPGYGDRTVAEHVFALLLAISHKMREAMDRTRRGDFTLQGLQGFDLAGKTLGVLGTGAIGRCVIEIARGFAMNVVAYDLRPNQEFAERLGFRYVDLPALLAQSDIITIHVPAIPETRHMLSEEQFALMKDGVVLINTARGTILDMHALLYALAEGKVAAAGLDVLPEEPVIREEAELLRSVYRHEHNLEDLLANHILLNLRNVYITPHSAFNTREAVQRIKDTTVENIVAFVNGSPQNVVVDGRPGPAWKK